MHRAYENANSILVRKSERKEASVIDLDVSRRMIMRGSPTVELVKFTSVVHIFVSTDFLLR
jgi:hypothetical protein